MAKTAPLGNPSPQEGPKFVQNKGDIEALRPKASTYPVRVSQKGAVLPGLYVQVTPAGYKSFVYRFRHHGRQKTYTIGSCAAWSIESAWAKVRELGGEVHKGINPSDLKREERQAGTVREIVEAFNDRHLVSVGPGWAKEAKRLLDKHVVPAIGSIRLKDVGPLDVADILYRLRGTPTQANRARAVLRKMMSWAEEEGLRDLGSNPVIKPGHKLTKRDRRLTDLEVKALGDALRKSQEAPEIKVAIRLAIGAGMRKGEIQGVRWEWVDLKSGMIRIPAILADGSAGHKTGKKTGKPRVIHLCHGLVKDLKGLGRSQGCPFIILGQQETLQNGNTSWKPFTALQNPWERLRDAAGLAPRNEDGEYLDPEAVPGLHDLRRTFGSVAADLGLKGFAGELLGHSEQTVTDIYTRSASERLHEAAETIGSRILGILDGEIDPEKEQAEKDRKEQKKSRPKRAK